MLNIGIVIAWYRVSIHLYTGEVTMGTKKQKQVKVMDGMLFNWRNDLEQQAGVKKAGDKVRKHTKTLYAERLAGMKLYFPDNVEQLLDDLELVNGSWESEDRKPVNNWQTSCGKCCREITKGKYTIIFPNKRDSEKDGNWRPSFTPVEQKDDSLSTQVGELLKNRINKNDLIDIIKMVVIAEESFRKTQEKRAAEKKAKTERMKVLSNEFAVYCKGIEQEHYNVACTNARATLEELKRGGAQVEVTEKTVAALAEKMMGL
jgi:Fe-S-cluster containining protein